jgi:hypothetical protein
MVTIASRVYLATGCEDRAVKPLNHAAANFLGPAEVHHCVCNGVEAEKQQHNSCNSISR